MNEKELIKIISDMIKDVKKDEKLGNIEDAKNGVKSIISNARELLWELEKEESA
jgi:hypothetical protein